MNLRLPSELHEALKRAASEDDRSLNSQIIHLLRRALDAREPPAPARPGSR